MAKKIDIPIDNNIIQMPLEEAMPDNYLPYAVEVARDRALPDVRDGLKPVHRRILFGAHLLKAYPDKPYFKSARIVGDILGKFHPHGDSSVYDAMVILAQDFTTRKPLIDGHGNWGSIDGDSAAAMRYTEARLTPLALEMLRDIDKDVVNMVNNYSDSELEPEVLPAKYPNLLVNGVFGIAVGLATNIPPHNLGEVIDGTLAFIDNKDITTKELMQHIKGPDLPTGGILIGKDSILAAYESGNGRVTLRAKTTMEKLENGRWGIVITEFPFRKNKARLLQSISEMTADKKHAKALEGIADIRDESDRTGIRAVIEFKKFVDEIQGDKILKYLLKKTELQVNLPFNMVAIADGKPQTMGIRTILWHYINHQKEVLTRRTKKELEIAERRFHIVEGFIKAINIMDQVIETIRASKSKSDASQNLLAKFGFTEIQATAILELMLYRLTGLEITAFEKEYNELNKLIRKLKKILDSEKELFNVIKQELLEIKEKYADARRTYIIDDENEAKIDMEELIVVEDIVITLSNEGYIKRVPQKTYVRSNSNPQDIEYREGDYHRFVINSNTLETILVFTDNGNMYQFKGNAIPELRWKEKGERLDTIIKGMNLDSERIINALSIKDFNESINVQFITSKGIIKKTALNKLASSYTKLMAIKIKEGQKIVSAELFDSAREECFVEISTSQGLNFIVKEPKLEESDRMVQGTTLATIPVKDCIEKVFYTKVKPELKKFKVELTNKGELKVGGKGKENPKAVYTDSEARLIIITSEGNVINISSNILENLSEPLNIVSSYGEIDKTNKFVGIISVSDFNDERYIMFFSKKGYVKKTPLKEYQGEYLCSQGYKLKNDSDELVGASLIKNKGDDFVVVTQKGMAIRVKCDDVNEMGKIASGVIGISLKDEDLVLYGNILSDTDQFIKVTTKNKEEKEYNLKSLPLQNRATRGKNIFITELEDYIIKVNQK